MASFWSLANDEDGEVSSYSTEQEAFQALKDTQWEEIRPDVNWYLVPYDGFGSKYASIEANDLYWQLEDE